MTIDIGNKCVECKQDTSFGSGRFVNRIPAERMDGVESLRIEGYLCPECQLEKCDKCGELSDCSGYNTMMICEDCVYESGTQFLENLSDDECQNFLKEEHGKKIDSFS